MLHVATLTIRLEFGRIKRFPTSLVRLFGCLYTKVDASYEGDLLAMAGAGWRVGRESRSEHGELNAGVVRSSPDGQAIH